VSDARQQRTRLDNYAMSRQASVRRAPDMPLGGRQVLDQAAAQVDVQNLHPAADCKNRNVASQRFIDQCRFGCIAFLIGHVGLGRSGFTIERGIDVSPAGQ
jgi:hypothetical protein